MDVFGGQNRLRIFHVNVFVRNRNLYRFPLGRRIATACCSRSDHLGGRALGDLDGRDWKHRAEDGNALRVHRGRVRFDAPKPTQSCNLDGNYPKIKAALQRPATISFHSGAPGGMNTKEAALFDRFR